MLKAVALDALLRVYIVVTDNSFCLDFKRSIKWQDVALRQAYQEFKCTANLQFIMCNLITQYKSKLNGKTKTYIHRIL